MTSDRRAFLASLAWAAALAACSGGGSSVPGSSRSQYGRRAPRTKANLLAAQIANKTGKYADKDVYFFLYGQGLPPDNDWYHLTDPDGTIVKCASTDLKYSADYSFSLADVSTIHLPPMRAARLSFSFEKKLLLQVNDAGIPTPPIGFDSTAQNVNYDTVFDFVEWTLSFPSDAGWNGNLTMVDAVNIPIDYHIAGESLTGTKLDYTRGFQAGGFSKFIAAMQANSDFAGLVLPGTGRVLAPNTGMEPFAGKNGPVFSKTYYDAYVDDVWTKYESSTLSIVTNQGATWTGRVADGKLTFTPQSGGSGLEPVALSKPTTLQVFACADICSSGCDSSNPLQRDVNNQIRGAVLAAFNRSTLLTNTTIGVNPQSAYCKDSSAFYRDKTTNYYSKYIHENTQGHLAYTFGIDDYCDQSSFVTVQKPDLFQVTLVPQ